AEPYAAANTPTATGTTAEPCCPSATSVDASNTIGASRRLDACWAGSRTLRQADDGTPSRHEGGGGRAGGIYLRVPLSGYGGHDISAVGFELPFDERVRNTRRATGDSNS